MSERITCFVIMPYSKESDHTYGDAILPALINVPAAQILALRADNMGKMAVTLKAHVETAVQDADFCIADLSGLNPNVLYELGYAMGVRKPVITICEQTSKLPSNLRESEVLYYSRDSASGLREALTERCTSIVESLLRIRTAHNRGPSEIAGTDSSVDPLLHEFMDSVDHSLSAIVGTPSAFVRTVLPRLRKCLAGPGTISVRLVILDPESIFAGARASVLNRPVAEYRQEMWKAIQTIREEFNVAQAGDAQLRFTDSIISSAILLSDTLALLSPYTVAQGSAETLMMLLDRRKNEKVFATLQNEFNAMWSSALPSKDIVGRSPETFMEDAG